MYINVYIHVYVNRYKHFLAPSTKQPGSSNTPEAMNTPSAQILVSKHNSFSTKRNQDLLEK